jgi:hypothetical protein
MNTTTGEETAWTALLWLVGLLGLRGHAQNPPPRPAALWQRPYLGVPQANPWGLLGQIDKVRVSTRLGDGANTLCRAHPQFHGMHIFSATRL